MNSYIRTRRTTDRHAVFPEGPCDRAPTWRQRQMDDLMSWGAWIASVASASVSVTPPRKTTKSIPIFDSPPNPFVHPSKTLQLSRLHHWSECCQFTRGVQDTIQHAAQVAFDFQLLLLPLGGRRRIPQILQRASSTHVQSDAIQSSRHLFQS